MIRLISVFLGFFPLMFITTIKSEDVKLTQQTQSKVYPGNETVVEVKIEKGDIEGFAKYQLDLPQGVTAQQIEVHGATFTFDEGTVKIIWLAVPAKNEFTFSYKLLFDAEIPNQTFKLGGRFSYLEENNRMIAEVNTIDIQVGDSPEEILAATPKEPASSTASKKVTQLSDGEYQVDISLNNTNIEGFSKIEEQYAEKFEIEPISTQNSVYSYVKNKVKFVWMSTPNDEKIAISYKVKTNGNPIDFNTVTGEYSFLDNNETKKTTINLLSQPELVAENTSEKENLANQQPQQTNTITEEPIQNVTSTEPEIAAASEKVKEEKPKEKPKTKASKSDEKENPKKETFVAQQTSENKNVSANSSNSIPMPENGIVYRVQILAGKNLVNQDYFEKLHNYSEPFITENHNGLVKYTNGQFDVYKAARDRREEINGTYSFPGPFVTAYNNGQRITVQEALMISNQKWYK